MPNALRTKKADHTGSQKSAKQTTFRGDGKINVRNKKKNDTVRARTANAGRHNQTFAFGEGFQEQNLLSSKRGVGCKHWLTIAFFS